MTTNKENIAFTAPHYATAQVGKEILEKGGSAIEAMVAAAASIAVQYPHMNGLGGDGFWLISEPGKPPIAIDASGTAAKAATLDAYKAHQSIPSRGPKSAITMAGAVAGWQAALKISENWQSPLPLSSLLNTAIQQAKWGIEVTQSLSDASFKTYDELSPSPAFSPFLIKGKALKKGKVIKLVALANTLQKLVENGLQDFYCGEIATKLANDLQEAGSPICLQDFSEYQAKLVSPLCVDISHGTLFNLPAPTQGIASLLILALFDKISNKVTNDADMVHALIECTKQAFIKRDQYLSDPSRLSIDLNSLLKDEQLNQMASQISMDKALDWPHTAKQGDTIWMGACDSKGRMVSYIQSLYWEFGSGVVSPSTGIVWNNRGTSFSLQKDHLQSLAPGLKPFHTLNPAYAELKDGRRMVYGTMGGEGQPQTQAAIFARHVYCQQGLQQSISLGRWLLGRTWGDESNNLKIESDVAQYLGEFLLAKGHEMIEVSACNELMGHAGAVVRTQSGELEAANDPRSDGEAIISTYPNKKYEEQ